MSLKENARRLKADVPALALALRDEQTPLAAKLLAGLTVAYALSPIDLIPDFIPVLGYLDDLIILPAMVALTLRLVPAEVFERCRTQVEGMWEGGKPKRWRLGLPVLLIWLLVVVCIARLVVGRDIAAYGCCIAAND